MYEYVCMCMLKSRYVCTQVLEYVDQLGRYYCYCYYYRYSSITVMSYFKEREKRNKYDTRTRQRETTRQSQKKMMSICEI